MYFLFGNSLEFAVNTVKKKIDLIVFYFLIEPITKKWWFNNVTKVLESKLTLLSFRLN